MTPAVEAPPATPDRCPRCDRPRAPASADAWLAVTRAYADVPTHAARAAAVLAVDPTLCFGLADCEESAVDWRVRAKRAEAVVAAARVQMRAADAFEANGTNENAVAYRIACYSTEEAVRTYEAGAAAGTLPGGMP